MERVFVNMWTRREFSNWNESDVREDFITPLLRVLGYSKGTVADVVRERTVKLSEPYHKVGRDRIKIDYVPTLRLRSFWIIEAKPGAPQDMTFGDLLQVHLYAIHPEVNVPLIVLTNGWSVRVYDALTVKSWDEPILVSSKDNCEQTFAQLRDLIGARSTLRSLRDRLLQHIENTFAVEIDERETQLFSSEVTKLMTNARDKVTTNARGVEIAAFREAQEKELQALEHQSLDLLIDVYIDLPTDARPVAAEMLAKRLIAADESSRSETVDRLFRKYQGRPHNVCRVLSLYILLRLLEAAVSVSSKCVSDLKPEIGRLALENANYWQSNSISNALCHLDNISLRVAKKIGNRFAMDALGKLATKLNTEMQAEDLLKVRPTTAKLMIPFVALLGERLWRQYCSLPTPETIWEGIWTYEAVEEAIDQLPAKTYPDRDSDLLWFEHYGKGFDMLRLGTWDVLNRFDVKGKHPDLPGEVLGFAGMRREEVMATIPPPKPRPAQWKPSALPEVLQTILQEAGLAQH